MSFKSHGPGRFQAYRHASTIRIVDEAGAMGWDVNVDTWNARPDVLSTMQGADSGNPGFQQSVDLSSLAPGNYKLTVVFSDAGASRICNPNRALVIE